MMYVAQIALDRTVAARRGLYGLYAWHKAVWDLFPGHLDDKRDFLTRFDEGETALRFMVMSVIKPKKPDWCIAEWWQERQLPQSFFEHGMYLFKVLTNPTRTLSYRDPAGNRKKNGSHYAITKLDELRVWFMKKAEKGGFAICDKPRLEISPPVFNRLYKDDKKGGIEHEGGIVGVEFKGALEVKNKDAFFQTVRNGVGRAKGFGFGLFVLKPIA